MIEKNKLVYNPCNFFEKKPITADLFLTNYCNNKCAYCTYKRWELPRNNTFVCFSDFKKSVAILQQMGVKGIILTGGGEPTVNPDFDQITSWLEEEKIPYGINTNFNLLKKISPVYLKISLDVSSPEEYKKIRGVDVYDKVIKNIKEYLKWREKVKNNTKVVLQCLVLDVDAAKRFYNSVSDLKVDNIVFRPVESTLGGYYTGKESLVDEQKKELGAIADKDPRVVMNYKWNKTKSRFGKCSGNCYQIAVNEKSEVIYCCHKPTEVIGMLSDKDILEKKEAFKSNMAICDVPCRLTGVNEFVNLYSNVPDDYMFI